MDGWRGEMLDDCFETLEVEVQVEVELRLRRKSGWSLWLIHCCVNY